MIRIEIHSSFVNEKELHINAGIIIISSRVVSNFLLHYVRSTNLAKSYSRQYGVCVTTIIFRYRLQSIIHHCH